MQIFNEEEKVRGFENLQIQIYLSPCTLIPYIDISYNRKARNQDDIYTILKEHYGKNGKAQ